MIAFVIFICLCVVAYVIADSRYNFEYQWLDTECSRIFVVWYIKYWEDYPVERTYRILFKYDKR